MYEGSNITARSDYVKVSAGTIESSEHPQFRAFSCTSRIRINKTSLLCTQDTNKWGDLQLYWVDSMNVRYWIQGQSRDYKLFIAHHNIS